MLPLGDSSDHDQGSEVMECLWTTLYGGLGWGALSFKSWRQKKAGPARELTCYFPVCGVSWQQWSAIEGTSRIDCSGIYILQKEGLGRSLAFFPLSVSEEEAAAVPKLFSFLFSSICSRCPFVILALCNHVSLGYLCVLLVQEMKNPRSVTDTAV